MADDKPLLDARGVEIHAGDTVVYGFGVGRSVAMAEGEVVGGGGGGFDVSLTPTGLVRIRVIRRSYASGEQPVVALQPDRFTVVLELPESPLPTQNEKAIADLKASMKRYAEALRETEKPAYWEEGDLASYHAWCAHRLAVVRGKLKALDG